MRVLAATILCMLQFGALPSGNAHVTPRDPYLRDQWGLKMIRAPQAWNQSKGKGAKVAVLDTGVDFRHPDLRENIAKRGIDFFDGDLNPRDEEGGRGHGTHVAGIIAAARNDIGIAGVAPEAEILPIRVCESDCSIKAIARGIRYAADHKADVINISLATGVLATVDGGNEAIRKAIKYAAGEGVVTVAAAGNGSLPLCSEPAASSICVGSINRDKSKALYSNSDATMQVPYVVAPGGDDLPYCESIILSTFPRYLDSVCSERGYEGMNGTSMAAPHVSGVAALLSSQGLEAAEIIARITATTEDLGPPGHDPIYGYGLVDASRATHR